MYPVVIEVVAFPDIAYHFQPFQVGICYLIGSEVVEQLDEMFMETTENADRLRAGIGNCRLFDIFKAVEKIFPEELEGVKEAFSNGSDIPEYIISIFGKGDVNNKKENEFLNALGL